LKAYNAVWHYFGDELYYPLSPPSLPDQLLIEVELKNIDAKTYKKETLYWYGKEVYSTDNNWGRKDPTWLQPFKKWLVKANSLEELFSIIDTILSNVKKLGIKEKIAQLKQVWD